MCQCSLLEFHVPTHVNFFGSISFEPSQLDSVTDFSKTYVYNPYDVCFGVYMCQFI